MLGLIGMALVFAATVMDNWCVKDRQGDMITSINTYKGLWRNCEVSNAGFTECRPLYGLIGFSGRSTRFVLYELKILGFFSLEEGFGF